MTARQKRVHGWRRRLRELDRWTLDNQRLDVEELLDTGDYSAEIWFERWPAPFPIGVRRRMVEHLFRIHDRWRDQLTGLASPFYLGVWLEPGFRGSRVAAVVGPEADWFASRHSGFIDVPPPPLYHDRPLDLARYQWTWRVETCLDRLSKYAEADRRELMRESRQHLRWWNGEIVIPRRLEWWYAQAHQDDCG